MKMIDLKCLPHYPMINFSPDSDECRLLAMLHERSFIDRDELFDHFNSYKAFNILKNAGVMVYNPISDTYDRTSFTAGLYDLMKFLKPLYVLSEFICETKPANITELDVQLTMSGIHDVIEDTDALAALLFLRDMSHYISQTPNWFIIVLCGLSHSMFYRYRFLCDFIDSKRSEVPLLIKS